MSQTFARSSLVYFILFTATSALNYVFIVIAARILGEEQFGLFNSLLSLLTVASLGFAAYQLALTESFGRVTLQAARTAIFGLTRQFARPMAVGVAVLLLSIPIVATLMGATYVELLATIAGCILLALSTLANGALAGLGKLQTQAWINLWTAALRIAVAVPLLLWISVTGGLLAYGVGLGLVFVFTVAVLPRSNGALSVTTHVGRRELETTILFLLLNLPLYLDLILVQITHRELSGRYAILANLGKMIYMGVSPLISATYVHLVRNPDDHAILKPGVGRQGAIMSVGAAMTAGLVVFAASDFIVTDLFRAPSTFSTSALLITLAASIVFVASNAVAVVLAATAMPTRFLWTVLIIPLVVQVVGLTVFRWDTVTELAAVQLATMAVQFVLLGIFSAGQGHREQTGRREP